MSDTGESGSLALRDAAVLVGKQWTFPNTLELCA